MKWVYEGSCRILFDKGCLRTFWYKFLSDAHLLFYQEMPTCSGIQLATLQIEAQSNLQWKVILHKDWPLKLVRISWTNYYDLIPVFETLLLTQYKPSWSIQQARLNWYRWKRAGNFTSLYIFQAKGNDGLSIKHKHHNWDSVKTEVAYISHMSHNTWVWINVPG